MGNKPHGLTTHGLCKTRFYRIYRGMLTRCTNSKDHTYKRYGAKGIKCLWESFEKFRDDMYVSYTEHIKEFGEKQTTIDRIDGLGNYCRQNCRWNCMKNQQRNRLNNHILEFRGEKHCVAKWAEIIGVSSLLVYNRLDRGWTTEEALTKPLMRIRNK